MKDEDDNGAVTQDLIREPVERTAESAGKALHAVGFSSAVRDTVDCVMENPENYSLPANLKSLSRNLGVSYDFLKKQFEKLGDAMVSAWKSIQDIFKKGKDLAGKAVNAIKEVMTKFGQAIKSFFTETLAKVVDIATIPARMLFYKIINEIDKNVIHPVTEKFISVYHGISDIARSPVKAEQASGVTFMSSQAQLDESALSDTIKEQSQRELKRADDKRERSVVFDRRSDKRSEEIDKLQGKWQEYWKKNGKESDRGHSR